MLFTPICKNSRNTAHSICISNKCKYSPFICQYCPNNTCQKIHIHDADLQTIKWSQIITPLESLKTIKDQNIYHQTVNKLEIQCENLIEEIRSVCNVYRNKIQKLRNISLTDEQEFNNNKYNGYDITFNKLKKEKYSQITGAEIRLFYQYIQKNIGKKCQEMKKYNQWVVKQISTLFTSMRDSIHQVSQSKFLKIRSQIQKKSIIQNEQKQKKIMKGQVSNHFAQGINLYKQQQFEQAKQQFLKSINDDKKNPKVYLYLGKVCFKLNNNNQAEKYFNKVIQLNPKIYDAYYNRAILLQSKYQYQAALNDYAKAIQLEPQNPKSYFNRALLYQELQNVQKALKDYSKSLQYDSCDFQAYYNRGLIYFNKNELQLSLRDFNKAIQNKKDFWQAYYNSGLVFERKHEYQKALNAYSKLIENNKLLQNSYKNRANIYRILQHTKLAEADEKQLAKLKKTTINNKS